MEAQTPKYIVVEGNIGAGKTSFCKKIAADLGGRLILEQFSDNPFLPLFYQNPERYAFAVELFFMSERHKQLQETLMEGDLFQMYTISDYLFLKTLIFAGQTLQGEEYRLFHRFFHTLNLHFPNPEILIYLHRPIEELTKNILHRGRTYEEAIEPSYLEKIQKAYFDFFKIQKNFPILILNLKDKNFLTDDAIYQKIKNILFAKEYEKGLHYIDI